MPRELRVRYPEQLNLGSRAAYDDDTNLLYDLALSIGQILPAAHVVKVDVALDPIRVAPFRVDRVMVQPHHVPNLVQ